MTLLRLALAASLLAAAASAAAEPGELPPPRHRLGLGVSLNTGLVGSYLSSLNSAVPASQVYVLVPVDARYRLEPTVGWASLEDEAQGERGSSLVLGLGMLGGGALKPDLEGYMGARAAVTWTKLRATGLDSEISAMNVTVAGVGGLEYLLGAAFTLGLEVQVQYSALGSRHVNSPAGASSTKGGHSSSTEGLFFLRGYFL
ncbi:MAG: hypothetical protein QM704_26870 [Anaeromyxobacteraceae bacterium]